MDLSSQKIHGTMNLIKSFSSGNEWTKINILYNQHFGSELEMENWNPFLYSFVFVWLCHSISDHFSVTAKLQSTFVLHRDFEQQGVCRWDVSKNWYNVYQYVFLVLAKRKCVLHLNVPVLWVEQPGGIACKSTCISPTYKHPGMIHQMQWLLFQPSIEPSGILAAWNGKNKHVIDKTCKRILNFRVLLLGQIETQITQIRTASIETTVCDRNFSSISSIFMVHDSTISNDLFFDKKNYNKNC
jgi:hypothetical protein